MADFDSVLEACRALGLGVNKPYTNPKGTFISVSCPLAPARHSDPCDRNYSCSVRLDPDGPSHAKCHSIACSYSGSWWWLVWQAVQRLTPVQPALLDMLRRMDLTESPNLDRDFERTMPRAAQSFADLAAGVHAISPSQAMPKWSASIPRAAQLYERDVLPEGDLGAFTTQLPPYVTERGLTPETAVAWGLCYDPRLGRLVFPVRRFDGALIGLTGRILPAREAQEEAAGREVTKYHNYSGLNKTRYLYGAHLFRRGLPLVLTEGPVDCIKTWQALHDTANVAATLGQGFGRDHLHTVTNVGQPTAVYLFFDDDVAGRTAAEKIGRQLERDVPLYAMRPVGAKDPGAMETPALRLAYEQAIPVMGDIYEALAGVDPLTPAPPRG